MTITWATGAATLVANWLNVKLIDGGEVAAGSDLQVAEQQLVHVVRNGALMLGGKGKPVPSLVPVAKQQGRDVA